MNILQMVLGAVTPAIIDKIGGMLGESPDATKKALGGAAPAILAGLLKLGSNEKGAEGIIGMLKNLPVGDSIGDLIGGHQDDAKTKLGSDMVGQVFGSQMGGVADLIGKFAGLKGGSAQSLLGILAPLVMGGLAKAAPSGGFSPQGLIGLLGSQKQHIADALPPELSGLGGLLGIADLDKPKAAAATYSPPPAYVPPPVDEETKKSGGILPWLVGAAAIAALLFLGPKMCATKAPSVTPPAAEAPKIEIPAGTLALPDGASITVPPGSVGEQLFNFLKGNDAAPKSFVFDNLEFDTGRGSYTAASQPTIDGITAILKAFPSTKVRIEGFTDSEGGTTVNRRLSQSRASAVASALVKAGIDQARVASAGLGEANPIGDNKTEEGRAKNRRIELVVTEK